MIKNTKRGFNLIEIAIVLAVIGLVIGGIYVAASAVTENNRKQNTQKQLLQIVQNVRSIYATQTTFVAPASHAAEVALKIFPGDLTDNGTNYLNAYGGTVTVAAGTTNQQFLVTFNGLSQSACTDLLTKGFGSTQSVNQIGLVQAGTSGGLMTAANVADGISIAEAVAACPNTTNTNNTAFLFNLRG